jgi:hypothetical protein
MSSKKQITIDPSGLSGGQATAHNATLKRQRKIKPPVALLRPSTVKKNLLEKIKNYKRHNEETPSREQHAVPKSDKDLANQFKTSVNYLEQLINKKREARKPHKSKTPTATKQPFQQQQQQPFQQQQQQPFQQQQQQPFQQQQQQQPVQVSLDLPPELQINPVNPFYPTQTELPFESFVPSVSEQFNPSPQPSQPQPSQPSQLSQPSHSNVLKDVPYGCLRNGIKPTYRTYHREMQKHNHLDNHSNATMNKTIKRGLGDAPNPNNQVSLNINPESDEMMQIQERQRKLRELQERAAANNAVNTATNDPAANDPAANDPITLSLSNDATSSETETNQISRPMRIKNKIRQTITKKYNLGRAPGSNVVGVLIKNNETRRQVQQEHGVLRRESIVEIRKYLHDHGLLKVGSDAPPDVLRNMYENAKLTGDVNNVNKHVMLHNFIATADSAPDHN